MVFPQNTLNKSLQSSCGPKSPLCACGVGCFVLAVGKRRCGLTDGSQQLFHEGSDRMKGMPSSSHGQGGWDAANIILPPLKICSVGMSRRQWWSHKAAASFPWVRILANQKSHLWPQHRGEVALKSQHRAIAAQVALWRWPPAPLPVGRAPLGSLCPNRALSWGGHRHKLLPAVVCVRQRLDAVAFPCEMAWSPPKRALSPGGTQPSLHHPAPALNQDVSTGSGRALCDGSQIYFPQLSRAVPICNSPFGRVSLHAAGIGGMGNVSTVSGNISSYKHRPEHYKLPSPKGWKILLMCKPL